MTDPKFHEAEKLFEQIKPAPVMTEYEREQQRAMANYDRLRAERLAREAELIHRSTSAALSI
jgi:hypothetical protein